MGVRLVTGDIPRFWEAFGPGDDPDAPDMAARLRQVYLEPGTVGLRALLPEREDPAGALVGALRAHRDYYASIRAESLQVIRTLPARLEPVLEWLSGLFPELEADLYVAVGALGRGGTLGREGGRRFAVVGLDFFCGGPHAATGSLSAWQRSVLHPADALPGVVAHELIHTLQPELRVEELTLRQAVLAEGTAEYLGRLISGETVHARLHEYGLIHEGELKRRLQADLAAGAPLERWLYQGEQAGDEPADLGYFLGSRIVQAYHERYRDRVDVLHELLHFALRDPQTFTRLSGYFG